MAEEIESREPSEAEFLAAADAFEALDKVGVVVLFRGGELAFLSGDPYRDRAGQGFVAYREEYGLSWERVDLVSRMLPALRPVLDAYHLSGEVEYAHLLGFDVRLVGLDRTLGAATIEKYDRRPVGEEGSEPGRRVVPFEFAMHRNRGVGRPR